jgi:ATP-dependent DNA helicase RecQ
MMSTEVKNPAIFAALKKFWGYDRLRPLQMEAIESGIANRDSLVVLPTGGGKSLCYQVPPIVANRTDVVVSPLISLMKDQVDALRACGYPAAALHSGLGEDERRRVGMEIAGRKHRLVFASPERLLTPWFMSLLQRADVHAFSIDEAHCISQWGHDFRPEYRRLAELRERFPDISLHAFTATATPRVRQDIVEQLGLQRPEVLVGVFDRPNLTYRVVSRVDVDNQVLEAVRRHAGEAVIVYCISRKDTEFMGNMLRAMGVRAAAYHAGLDSATRIKVQEAFAAERLDVVVATVAFGMGIDRSNVRCVIHAAMPKSIEHYQQETGRAGRDGLEAECVLFHSTGDFRRWESILLRSATETQQPVNVTRAQIDLLNEVQRFATSNQCRHRALSRYFGQEYEPKGCGACDVCLGERRQLQASMSQPASADAGWKGVDRGLFERLRDLRRSLAEERTVPPFVIFSDATLRDLARYRPVTLPALRAIKGIGERKQVDFGPRFVSVIATYCKEHSLSVNETPPEQPADKPRHRAVTGTVRQAFDLFDKQQSLDEVAAKTGRARSTVASYLDDFVAERKPESVAPWVDADTYQKIETTARRVGGSLMRPVFEALEGAVPYDDIRVVMRHAGLR